MLFTQLIILLTVTSQALSVTISDLNNIASNQVTKRLGGGSRGSSSSGSRVVQAVALAVALVVALVVALEVVVQVAARAVAPEVVARVAVVHPVVEIGEVINTIVVETSCGYGNYYAPSAAAAAVGYGTGRYTGGTQYGNNQYHCSGSTCGYGNFLHHQQLQLQPDTVQQDIMLSTIIQLPVKVKLFPDHHH